jgi:GAF domain-containing protein
MTGSLSERIAAAARAMEGERDPATTMDKAVRLAVDLVGSAQEAGITLVGKKELSTPAATSDTVNRIDQLQFEHQQGPCLDAIRKQEVVYSPDIAGDDRWGAWGRQVLEETGVRSMMCFRLFTRDETVGALNLYSRQTDAFDDDDHDHGLAIAAHAAVAVSGAHEISRLQTGMDGRLTIGQAQGILMERYQLSAEQAFEMLRRVSQHRNVRLATLAARLVADRRTPGT